MYALCFRLIDSHSITWESARLCNAALTISHVFAPLFLQMTHWASLKFQRKPDRWVPMRGRFLNVTYEWCPAWKNFFRNLLIVRRFDFLLSYFLLPCFKLFFCSIYLLTEPLYKQRKAAFLFLDTASSKARIHSLPRGQEPAQKLRQGFLAMECGNCSLL